jgi:hypothetical protein
LEIVKIESVSRSTVVRLLICTLCLLLQAACSRPGPKARAGHRPLIDVPASTEAQHAADFLAGRPGAPDSPFQKLEQLPSWRHHSAEFSAVWQRFRTRRLPALRDFQKSEIAAPAFATDTLFYPFGGPDILTAATLFPHQKTYLLVGLEPPGSIPTLSAVNGTRMDRYLPRLRFSLESLFRRSFFITANMDAQYRGQITDGVLPALLVQLSHLECAILGVQPVDLASDGTLVARPGSTKIRDAGVVIAFRFPGDSETRHLLYFSVNLHNQALPGNTAFQKFLTGRKPFATFFKSASYLPHRNDFSFVRQLVLDNSQAVLQDDTGIPYRYIDRGKWSVKLYGKYSRPYGSFRYRVQPDLQKAFHDHNSVRPLGFYLGYGYGRAPSTLLAFSRRN